ncbi:MAG: hypothetical protein ACE5HO_09645 [bacterium]
MRILDVQKKNPKTYLDDSMDSVPSLHLFADDHSRPGPYFDIDFVKDFKQSLCQSLDLARELISPSEEQAKVLTALGDIVPREFVPGLLILKSRILQSSHNGSAKLLLFNAPHTPNSSTEILGYFAKLVAKSDGKRLLMINLNSKSHSYHELFDVANNRGLSELPTDKRIIQRTDCHNIDVVVGGSSNGSLAAQNSYKRVATFIQSISCEYDLILLDTPPLSELENALTQSKCSLQRVLLLIHDNKGTWAGLKATRDRLGKHGVQIIGLRIN